MFTSSTYEISHSDFQEQFEAMKERARREIELDLTTARAQKLAANPMAMPKASPYQPQHNPTLLLLGDEE